MVLRGGPRGRVGRRRTTPHRTATPGTPPHRTPPRVTPGWPSLFIPPGTPARLRRHAHPFGHPVSRWAPFAFAQRSAIPLAVALRGRAHPRVSRLHPGRRRGHSDSAATQRPHRRLHAHPAVT